MAFSSAFQRSAFQANAFQIPIAGSDVTDTDAIPLPINCVMAGTQLYRERYREYDVWAPKARTNVQGTRSGVKRLKGDKPSFTVTTGKRGYD